MKEKPKEFKIFFNEPKMFSMQNIKPLSGLIGLYFIFCEKTNIQYPFKASRLVYIGMSEKKTNGIGSRLTGHFEGKSKNIGLVSYRKTDNLLFTYINFEIFRTLWKYSVEDLENYFILDFVAKYGVYPICNNKSGYDILKKNLRSDLNIDWIYFE